MTGWCATMDVSLHLRPPRRYDGPRAKALLYESEDGTLEVRSRGERLAWEEIPAAQSSCPAAEHTVHVPYSRPRPKPGQEHPYKRGAEDSIRRMRRKMLRRAVAARAAAGAAPPPAHPPPPPPPPPPSPPPHGAFFITEKQGAVLLYRDIFT